MSQISIELFMSKKKLSLFITSIESIYFSHSGWIATDNGSLFILLVRCLECCLLACISALLFVFSTDESTDWQSDGTLDDSAKPWPRLAVQLFKERARKRETEREREGERQVEKKLMRKPGKKKWGKMKGGNSKAEHHLILPIEKDPLLIITHLHWCKHGLMP